MKRRPHKPHRPTTPESWDGPSFPEELSQLAEALGPSFDGEFLRTAAKKIRAYRPLDPSTHTVGDDELLVFGHRLRRVMFRFSRSQDGANAGHCIAVYDMMGTLPEREEVRRTVINQLIIATRKQHAADSGAQLVSA